MNIRQYIIKSITNSLSATWTKKKMKKEVDHLFLSMHIKTIMKENALLNVNWSNYFIQLAFLCGIEPKNEEAKKEM